MKRRVIYGVGIYICIMQMFFTAAFPCHAAEIGTGVSLASEERPTVTSVSISPGTVVVSKNATQKFTASVTGTNNYNTEVAWSVSGQANSNTFIDGNGVLNVASDETASSLVVKAISKQDSNYSATALVYIQASTYHIQLQASPENGGSVYGSGEVREGGYVVISASPSDGYSFTGWILNNNRVSQDARYVVDNVRGDATYVAEFTPIDCRITVNVNDSNAGTATESKTVKYGEGIAVEAFPKEGYQFDSWTENGNNVSRDRRMQIDKVTGDRTFTAVFKKKEAQSYTITASVTSANGTIMPEGKTTVAEGTAVMYTITPKQGYAIRTVYVDGAEVGKTASFNFSNVQGDHTISADFVEAPQQADVNAKPSGGAGQEEKRDQADKTVKADNNDDPQKKQDEAPKKEETEQKDKEKEEETEKPKEPEVLEITVHNDFADGRQENFGVSGLESAAEQLLSKEEKRFMQQGELSVSIDLFVRDMEGKTAQEIKDAFEEQKLPSMTVGRYFELALEETKQGEKHEVSALAEKLKVVLHVPQPLQAENRDFYILGLYTKADGSYELAQLVDEDESPDTITFFADRFAPYAIAYIDWDKAEEGKTEDGAVQNSKARNAAGAVIVVMAVIVTVTGIWYIVGRKKK